MKKSPPVIDVPQGFIHGDFVGRKRSTSMGFGGEPASSPDA